MLLYRFLDLAGFVCMIGGESMFLRQVATYDDPYETDALSDLIGVLLEDTVLAKAESASAPSQRITELREVFRDTLVDRTLRSIYAQCWTELRESDALWRIYSPDVRGIRIAVERDTLLTQIGHTFPDVDHFKIEYCSAKCARVRLRDRFEASKSSKSSKSILLTTCCRYKRQEFEHEREYRLCMAERLPDIGVIDFDNESSLQSALDRLKGCSFQGVKPYSFDPTLIREVTLDPRQRESWFEETIRSVCKLKGLGSPVERSHLYTR